ncbi:hypothetical protein [Planctomycetes bacterium Poly30]
MEPHDGPPESEAQDEPNGDFETRVEWEFISFHRTNDRLDGALVAAARITRAEESELTSRGALKTRDTGEAYETLDGRWRARRSTPSDCAAANRTFGQDAAWILEQRVESLRADH